MAPYVVLLYFIIVIHYLKTLYYAFMVALFRIFHKPLLKVDILLSMNYNVYIKS